MHPFSGRQSGILLFESQCRLGRRRVLKIFHRIFRMHPFSGRQSGILLFASQDARSGVYIKYFIEMFRMHPFQEGSEEYCFSSHSMQARPGVYSKSDRIFLDASIFRKAVRMIAFRTIVGQVRRVLKILFRNFLGSIHFQESIRNIAFRDRVG